ncbi:MerR family transcriptional regulator [Paenibacillus sp. TRM 82003]|nr:MerR family transcriptional regulator [Paenibacillus sp. TRM 82003]
MHITELARRLNVSARTIRFYEEKGLLKPAKHPDNGYRLFGESDARRMQTILSLREVGMSVEDIRQALEQLDRDGEAAMLHALELQRSIMFSQWVELLHHLRATDEIIASMKAGDASAWDDLFEAASGLRKLKDVRANWRDHWDFDRQASVHDELVKNGETAFNRHPRYEETLSMIVQWVKARGGERGLDLGTGTGNLAGRFLAGGVEMAGVDQSREMLKRCNAKFPRLETKLGNLLAVPYLDRSFDFVVSSYALHHLTEEQKELALAEMRRVLKPHGRICIADLMFEGEEARRLYVDRLVAEGREDVAASIENEYFADRSKLLAWFDRNEYIVRTQPLTELLHIVYAVPMRPSPGVAY